MKKLCDSIMTAVDNESGMTMVVTLMVLLLLTIIGVAGITTSTTETMISSAEAEKRTTFYAAESGIEQAIASIIPIFNNVNLAAQRTALATGGDFSPAWTFALDGSQFGTGTGAQPQPTPPSNWKARFDKGVALPSIPDNHELRPGYTYTVRVWNNVETPIPVLTALQAAQTDTDGIIVVGAIATGPHSARSAVEIVLYGGTNDAGFGSSYTGQQGGGSGKNYNALDARAINATSLVIGGAGGMSVISN